MNLEAERYVIGCLLREPHLLAELTLCADDFQAESTRNVFATIQNMARNNKAIDVLTVTDQLGDN